MSTEPAPKIWLQNKLNRSRTKAQELAPLILLKGRLCPVENLRSQCSLYPSETEFNHLSKKLQTNIADHPVGPVDDIVDVRSCQSDLRGFIEKTHPRVCQPLSLDIRNRAT